MTFFITVQLPQKKAQVGQGLSKCQWLSQISWLQLSGDLGYQHDFSWFYMTAPSIQLP